MLGGAGARRLSRQLPGDQRPHDQAGRAQGDAVRAGRRVAAARGSSSHEPGQGRRRAARWSSSRTRAGKALARPGARQEGAEEGPAESAAQRRRTACPPGRYVLRRGGEGHGGGGVRSAGQGGGQPRQVAQPRISSRPTASGRSRSGRKAARRTGRSRAPRNGASGNSRPAAAISTASARGRGGQHARLAVVQRRRGRSRSRRPPSKPVVVVAETFDNLIYTVKLARKAKRRRLSRDLHGDGRAPEEPRAGEGREGRSRRSAATRISPRPASGSRSASPRSRRSRSGPTSSASARSSRC